ncbi:hypothetical protein [Methylobacterium nonmethylotrophicum]|uniref:Uncharacterized protein n=1 Tax=Methylobacterium nonmethylotrophicum TaxID=1141884 RepID=A0A4Z0NI49_9HYPH|nr:hypothetical protein [Methylobacterium nonmethylotrophicum]TGD95354.1 hypothetical protein EU555_28455 [Methylobacterium nonmethylotrophicum]
MNIVGSVQFAIMVTTGAAGTILRAPPKRLAAGKAEDVIRREHHRGAATAREHCPIALQSSSALAV